MMNLAIFSTFVFALFLQKHLTLARLVNNNEEISSLVKKLIVEMNHKQPITNDVVLLKLLVNEKSKHQLDDI